jgi:hypothetical protein
MDKEDRKYVGQLLKKAAETGDSGDAVKFAQAALNAASALFTLKELERE